MCSEGRLRFLRIQTKPAALRPGSFADAQDDSPFPVILGQIRDRCRGQKKGACLRRREKSAEQRRREICSAASCDGKSTQCSYRHSETEEISTGCGASGGVTKRKEAR